MAIAPEVKNDSNCEGFGKLLGTNPQTLLSFYVEHNRSSLEKLREGLVSFGKNPGLPQLLSIKRYTDEVAFDLISLCPGTDNLQNADLEVLFRHCSFVSMWLNLAYVSASENTVMEERNGEENLLTKYLHTSHAALTSEFRRLQLDDVEFSALKAVCIWKMGRLDHTDIAKILSGEQYLGVAKALNEYHQTKPMQDFQMAARLADITAMLAPISAVFQDMTTMYTALSIDDTYRGDFF